VFVVSKVNVADRKAVENVKRNLSPWITPS